MNVIHFQKRLQDSRILMVDDSEYSVFLVTEILKNGGYTNVAIASSGAAALDSISAQIPDLIIADVLMPEMDGFELCRRIRALPHCADIPIIVETAMHSQEERVNIFRHGATDLMVKPLNPVELLARVRIHLEKKHLMQDLQNYQHRVEGELSDARKMQFALLPDDDALKACRMRYGLKLSQYYDPSEKVGGDFWMLHPLDENRVLMTICDFSGHGVTAAMNCFRLHAVLHQQAAQYETPGTLLSGLNQFLFSLLPVGHYATFCALLIDTNKRRMTYAAAGSPTPMIHRAGNTQVEKLNGRGIPLGITPDATYETRETEFHPGDALFLYSDAITDCHAPGLVALSEEVIAEQLSLHAKKEWNDLFTSLMKMHQPATQQHTDDVTLVLCQWNGISAHGK